MDEEPATHIAFAIRRENPSDPLRRERRAEGHQIEIGLGWISIRCENCGAGAEGGNHRVFLDRLPTGGFNGHVYLRPTGGQHNSRRAAGKHGSDGNVNDAD